MKQYREYGETITINGRPPTIPVSARAIGSAKRRGFGESAIDVDLTVYSARRYFYAHHHDLRTGEHVVEKRDPDEHRAWVRRAWEVLAGLDAKGEIPERAGCLAAEPEPAWTAPIERA